MSIMIFDCETTSLDKPFCYNIGYVITDEEFNTIVERDFVCEQVWHNPMLFSTAYYADKRENYIRSMRGRTTTMDKFGYICQTMIRDIKKYDIVGAYAYNSPFDERVFNFNCDWFKCNNPFDTIPIYDIRGYAQQFLCDEHFKEWCEKYQFFTDSGNYSTTAETLFRYITQNTEFIEEHTALADSQIEKEILYCAIECGAELNTPYHTYKSIPRKQIKNFTVKYNGDVVFNTECESIRYMKTNNTVILKG